MVIEPGHPGPAGHRSRRTSSDRRPRHSPGPFRTTLVAARWVSRLRRKLAGRRDVPRLVFAIIVGITGMSLAGGASMADEYLHRGIESGSERPVTIQPTGRDVAVNIDLSRFPTNQFDTVAATLRGSGFRYVRQTFAWADIEPQPEQFRWERYDAMIDALERHSLIPLAVLHRSPSWARSDGDTADDSPPRDFSVYGRFVEAVVGRYGDRLPFVQIWDHPNLSSEWGDARPDPNAYASLLAFGFNASQTTNQKITVLLAELATPDDPTAANDLDFLRGIYRAGGREYFHVASIRLDGGDRSPQDRRVEPELINLSRALLYRELMVAEEDGAKPIWATHYGWATDPAGRIDADTQARFGIDGLKRARFEWPWMGLIFSWGLLPPTGDDQNQEGNYSLLNADGSATPWFLAITDRAWNAPDIAASGYVPVTAAPFSFGGNWADQHLEQGHYRTTSEVGARITLRFDGTGISLLLRLSPEAGAVSATVDGTDVELDLVASQARNLEVPLVSGLSAGIHVLRLSLAGEGQLTVGGAIVERDNDRGWPIVMMLWTGILGVGWALREAALSLAQRFGYLQRRRGLAQWPELPMLPEWHSIRRG